MKIIKLLLILTLVFSTLLCSCNYKKNENKDIDQQIVINPYDKVVFEDADFKDLIANTIKKEADELTFADLDLITGINISYTSEPVGNTNTYQNIWSATATKDGFDEIFEVYYNTPKDEREGLEDPSDYCYNAKFDEFNGYNDLKLLTNLKNFTIGSEYVIINMNPLEYISTIVGLEKISIYNYAVPDLTLASKFTNLISLDILLNNRNIPTGETIKYIEDLSPVSSLTKLESLSLSGSIISDLSPVSQLENLKVLSITNAALSDISPVAKMENLVSITLEYNGIQDITPIANLTKLETINLDYNYISDLTPFKNLDPDVVKYVSVDMNPVSDDTPLRHLGEDKVNLGYDVYWDYE